MKELHKTLLIGILTLGFAACSEDDTGNSDTDSDSDSDTDTDTDTDTDSDSDTDSDTDTDTDTDSDTDTATDSDSGLVDFVWIVPTGSTFDDAYGSNTVQIVDTDFDVSGVDLTMGGLNQDIPAPTVDCMDPSITQDCISVSGLDRTGQFFELLCLGEDGVSVGTSDVEDPDNLGTWITRNGGSCDIWTEEPIEFDTYVLEWNAVPTTFSETVNSGDGIGVPIYIRHEFDALENSPYGSTSAINLVTAKMSGYVRHTTDFGDPADSLMEGVFASSWEDGLPTWGLRLRGTIKAYF